MKTMIYGIEAAVKSNVGVGWRKEPSISYYGGMCGVNILTIGSIGSKHETVQIINHFGVNMLCQIK
jgi:hypothetical protein